MEYSTTTIANGVSGGEDILPAAPGAGNQGLINKIILSYNLAATTDPCYLQFSTGTTTWKFRLNAGNYGGFVFDLAADNEPGIKDGWRLDVAGVGNLMIREIDGISEAEVDPVGTDTVDVTFLYVVKQGA